MVHPLQDVALLTLRRVIDQQEGIVDMAVSIRTFFDYRALYGKMRDGLVDFCTGCVLMNLI